MLGSGLDQELEDVTGQLRGWQEDLADNRARQCG